MFCLRQSFRWMGSLSEKRMCRCSVRLWPYRGMIPTEPRPSVPQLPQLARMLSICSCFLSSVNLFDHKCILTHWGRVKQICVFNTRLFSLHSTLNYAIHRACLRMVLLTDVYRNLTTLWINLYAPRFLYIGTGVSLLSRERFLYI